MIVCIEGSDAVGKATQSKILAKALNASSFAFPAYDTTVGNAILANLKSQWTAAHRTYQELGSGLSRPVLTTDKALNALVLQSLMLTNRMELGAELRAAAANGHVVIDRYTTSSTVYGKLDGLAADWLEKVNAELPVQPDIYILLDAPVDEGFKRRPERRDRYETDRDFLEKVRIGYLELFKEKQARRAALVTAWKADNYGPRWEVVDALGTIEEVATRVLLAVSL